MAHDAPKKNFWIAILGMMGSGKSVLINEYLFERPDARKINFTPPPVEAKFRGMDFEFVDQIFALEQDGINFNFYELDAPTINKWTQFISIADAIIVAYNYKKEDYFESPQKFIQNIKNFSKAGIPLYFAVNACDSIEAAKSRLEDLFTISEFQKDKIAITVIPEAVVEYTKEYGRRVRIDISILDKLYENVIKSLTK